jgi:hypothetical protein
MPREPVSPSISEALHLSEAQFLRERCLYVIRESSMLDRPWRWTILADRHEMVAEQTKLKGEESPIVSFCHDAENWTLLTTRRMIAKVFGLREEVSAGRFGAADFGNFKGDVKRPTMSAATVLRTPRFFGRGRPVSFFYESGYASMPPIAYFKFWAEKWPVWKRAYECTVRSEAATGKH